MEDHDQVALLIAPAFHAIVDFLEDIGFQIPQGRQGGGSAHGGWGLGLEKESVTTYVGGRISGPPALHKDPISKREIGGKPAGKHLFIANGRNLKIPMH
jgi:hypothetical protein